INALKPGEEQDKLRKQLEVVGIPFAQKALELAREDDRDDISISAAMYAFLGGLGSKTTAEAADFIVEHLANNLKIVPTFPQLVHTKGGPELLARLDARTKSNEVRGAIRFALLDAEVEETDQPQGGTTISAADAAVKYAAATDRLKKLAAEFAGVKVTTRLGNSISEAAEKKIYFIEHLIVGKRAPDFE